MYGHGGEQVPDALRDADLSFVRQEPQLGTGHAVKQALPQLDARTDTLVLYGDVPLIAAATLEALCSGSGERLKILTAEVAEPRGYGRIVRNAQGAITAIVEEKDATAQQREIREINTGIMPSTLMSNTSLNAARSSGNSVSVPVLTPAFAITMSGLPYSAMNACAAARSAALSRTSSA